MADDVIINLLSQRNWFMYNKDLAFLIGAKEAILVGHLVNKYTIHKESGNLIEGGWFYESREFIMVDTGLDVQFQKRATNKLVELSIIYVRKIGIPARNYYKINPQGLQKALEDGQARRESEIIEFREKVKNKIFQQSKKGKTQFTLENGISPQCNQNEHTEENPVNTTVQSKGTHLTGQNDGTGAVKNDELVQSKLPTNNNKQKNNQKKEITFAEMLNQIVSIWTELTGLKDYPTDKLKSTVQEYGSFDLEEFRHKVSNFALIKNIVQEQPWLKKYIFIDLDRMTLSAFVASYYNIFDEKLETALTKISNVKEQKSIPKLFGAFGIVDEMRKRRIEEDKLLSEQEKLKKEFVMHKLAIADEYIQSKQVSGEYEGLQKEYEERLVHVNQNGFILPRYLEHGFNDDRVMNHFKTYIQDKYLPQITFETRKQENSGGSRVEE